nr:hypothetical protein [Prosthecochloris aestuarii]
MKKSACLPVQLSCLCQPDTRICSQHHRGIFAVDFVSVLPALRAGDG